MDKTEKAGKAEKKPIKKPEIQKAEKKGPPLKTELLKKVRSRIFLTKEENYGKLFFVLHGTSRLLMSTDIKVMIEILREARLSMARSIIETKKKLKF